MINAKQQLQSRVGLQPDQGPTRILRQSPHSQEACLGREPLLLLLLASERDSGRQLNELSWSGACSEPGEGVWICWIQQRQKLETNKSPGGEPRCVQGLPQKI